MENDSVEKTVKEHYGFLDNKAKKDYQANKEKKQERSRKHQRSLSEDEKTKERNYANIRNINIWDEDGERKSRTYQKLSS